MQCNAIADNQNVLNAKAKTFENVSLDIAQRDVFLLELNEKYKVKDVANKVSTKLLKVLLDNKTINIAVDLFISDDVNDFTYTKNNKYINAQATYTFNLDTNKSSYTLNGEKSIDDSIAQYMVAQEFFFAEKKRLREEKRQKNIKKITLILKNNKKINALLSSTSDYVSINLDKHELAKLLKEAGDAINAYDIHSKLTPSNTAAEWDNSRNGYLQGVSITQMHGVWNDYFPNTRGENIAIYYSDAHCPNNGNDLYYGYVATTGACQEVGNLNDEDTGAGYHTRIITGILSTVANEVNLLCNDHARDSSDVDSRLPTAMGNINIETYSLNNYNDNTLSYKNIDVAFDHHAFNNRTIPVFVSAGNKLDELNPDNHVLSPAKAFNITTVGSYGRDAVAGTLSWSNFSSNVNPETIIGNRTIQKPEVSGPGEHFHCADIVGDDSCHELFNEDSGTSFATPWIAAMAADAMSRGSYWRSSAAMVKALVISGASDPIAGTRDEVGEGGVDLFTMTWQNTNSGYWYDANPSEPFSGTNPSQFDYNNNCFTNWQTQLYDGRDQRIVISWLNDITNATTLSNIPNSYSLELINSNGSVVESTSEDTQGYQIINTNQPAGLYTVRVCKLRQNSSQRFDMGFSVSQRTTQWWD